MPPTVCQLLLMYLKMSLKKELMWLKRQLTELRRLLRMRLALPKKLLKSPAPELLMLKLMLVLENY